MEILKAKTRGCLVELCVEEEKGGLGMTLRLNHLKSRDSTVYTGQREESHVYRKRRKSRHLLNLGNVISRCLLDTNVEVLSSS